MLAIDSITYGYKKKENLYADFSLRIEPNKICGLLGHNGVGKSTLLYLMCGLLRPKKGVVKFNQRVVTDRDVVTLQEMFIVPEEFDFPAMKLNTYIKLNKVFYPKYSDEQMAKYLDCFGLSKDIRLDAISMGQKKKGFISFALATNTSLLLMDEPTNGLDIPGKSQFRKLMAMAMEEDKSIVISTHQVRDIDRMLDQIIILDDKGVVLNQPVSTICEKIAFLQDDNVEPNDEEVLFSQPSESGNAVMIENKNQLETTLDLEMLYNGLLNNKEAIVNLFNDDK